eukprot:TRINITY_DN9017_c0_g1_i1.p1 TRINITY_DN9017_c0_g1~~TRINITY_DN9017_c0_g1_i1.p1  ORF type:complete len:313 (+),score=24.47 TRINITY_DN9017_c0_g1_i1:53-940(+)
MLKGLSRSQLTTKISLFRGCHPVSCSQRRGFRSTNFLLGRKHDKPPIDLAKVKEQSEYLLKKMGASGTAGKAKEKVSAVFSHIDIKLAEYGIQNDGGGVDALRYLISACLVMWLLFVISPPSMKQFLANNFLVSADNAHRLYPLLSSMLLHTGIMDLLFSSLILYSMAPQVMGLIGVAKTWQLIFGAHFVSNLYYVSHESSVPRNFMSFGIPQGGLSNAAHAVVAVSCFLRPTAIVQFFFVQVQSLHVAYVVTGIDIFRFLNSARSNYSGAASHVGGAMFGAGYWYLVLNQATYF